MTHHDPAIQAAQTLGSESVMMSSPGGVWGSESSNLMGVADMGTTLSCSTLLDVQSTIGKQRDMPLPPEHPETTPPTDGRPSSLVVGGMGVEGADDETPRPLLTVAQFL